MKRISTFFSKRFAGPGQVNLLLVMRETFIAILPVYMIMSLLELGSTLFNYSNNPGSIYDIMQNILTPVRIALPYTVAALLGYNLARYKKVDPLVGALISGISFCVVVAPVSLEQPLVIVQAMSSIYSIVIPLFAIYLLRTVQRQGFALVKDTVVSSLLTSSVNAIIPAIVTVLASSFVFHFVSVLVIRELGIPGDYIAQLPQIIQGCIRMFVVHVLWTLGIHGTYVYSTLMSVHDLNQTVSGNFTMGSLLNTFVLFGGAGGTLSMMLAMLLRRHAERDNLIPKISMPLQLFNINELLIFGYPIVFNPYLAIPFIIYPVVGFLLAYGIASLHLIPLAANVHWVLPVGINAYEAGGGSLLTILFQLLMLGVGTAIYYPFLGIESGASIRNKLKKIFSDEALQAATFDATEERYIHLQKRSLEVHKQATEAINLISSGTLELWYQPQICMKTMKVHGFEALLRLRMPNGKIIGPAFIDKLQNAGYSDAVDNWVIKQALDDLRTWKQQGFEPRVSLNLTADFLSSDDKVRALISKVETASVGLNLEMLESSFTDQFLHLADNVNNLRTRGFELAIDDFGTGYSNLSLLHQLGIDTVKLDKSLVTGDVNSRGARLYVELCRLLKAFDYKVVAEGVETDEQLALVRNCGVDVVQGWYFAAAMPPKEAMNYAWSRDDDLSPVAAHMRCEG